MRLASGSRRGFGVLVTLGATIAVLASTGTAWGAAGDLDPSFSGDGILTTPSSSVGVGSVAVDSRGRIVVASIDDGFRYMPNGTPDKSFSGDGRVKCPFCDQTGSHDLNALAIDAQDRIVVVGSGPDPATPGNNAFAVARFLPNGTLDRTFADKGIALTPMGDAGPDYAADVAIDTEGRIVVAGISDAPDLGSSGFALARYLPDGKLDPAFSGDGRVQTELPGVVNSDAYAVALDSKGRIVLAGSGDDQLAVARYTSSGRLDPSFSGDGTETTAVGPSGSQSHGWGVTVDDLNRIVVVGDEGGITRRMALVRYRPSGSLDPSFSDDGEVRTRFNRDRNIGYGVTIDHHNRIVAVASINDLTPEKRQAFGVARYTPDGSLDPAFSQDGRVITSVGKESYGEAVTIDPRDKVVVAGWTRMRASGGPSIAVARCLGE